jgi:hypothetical protein
VLAFAAAGGGGAGGRVLVGYSRSVYDMRSVHELGGYWRRLEELFSKWVGGGIGVCTYAEAHGLTDGLCSQIVCVSFA